VCEGAPLRWCARGCSLARWLTSRLRWNEIASPIASANRLCRVIIRAILLLVRGILPGYISSIRVGDLVGGFCSSVVLVASIFVILSFPCRVCVCK
jgi:hypothetical protein